MSTIPGKLGSILVAGLLALACSDSAVGDDDVVLLPLTPDEAAFLRTEMADMLTAVQEIVDALAEGEMQAVSEAARPMGMRTARKVPDGLRAKLPPEFKQMGHAVHTGFDEVAMAAEGGESAEGVLYWLGVLLSNCGGCHGRFRIR